MLRGTQIWFIEINDVRACVLEWKKYWFYLVSNLIFVSIVLRGVNPRAYSLHITSITANHTNAMMAPRLRIRISVTYLSTTTTPAIQLNFADLLLALQFCINSSIMIYVWSLINNSNQRRNHGSSIAFVSLAVMVVTLFVTSLYGSTE